MRNSKFVRYSAVLLGLVVLRTKPQNGFCPMCTKEYYIVLTHSNPFWGQICKTDSHTHQSNKCAALVPLRNADTNITRLSHRKSPTNRYISFTLRQEVVRKYHATTSPYTAPVAARNAPVWTHPQCIGVVLVQPNIALKSPLSGNLYSLRLVYRITHGGVAGTEVGRY